MAFSDDRIAELNYGYDLDGGGYSFEEAPKQFGGACVAWDDPDRDYLGITDCTPDWYSHSCPIFIFAPNSGHFGAYDFQDSYIDSDGDTRVKVYEGNLHGSDRECNCHGKLVPWTGAAGEPQEPVSGSKVAQYIQAGIEVVEGMGTSDGLYFEHSGDTSDKPYPDCHRCDGDGYVDSPGGEWSVYALAPEDEDDDEDDDA